METQTPAPKRVLLVGCGGIGGWLGQLLARTLQPEDTLELFDRDRIEERNIDRQLFGKEDIGRCKCTAMRRRISHPRAPAIVPREQWFSLSTLTEMVDKPTLIMVAADNNAARTSALDAADRLRIPCIVAANEYDDAEAYIYLPQWAGSQADPRTYYPELQQDDGNNPANPGCTGVAQIAAPQLAIANMNAASYAAWLFHAWTTRIPAATAHVPVETGDAIIEHVPYFIRNTWGRVMTRRLKDHQPPQETPNAT